MKAKIQKVAKLTVYFLTENNFNENGRHNTEIVTTHHRHNKSIYSMIYHTLSISC